MRYKDEVLVLKNENGEEKEYAILVTFDIEIKNKSYVLYTDYSKDENNNLKIFVASYDENWKLTPIEEDDKIEFIDRYIKDLEEEIKDGIKFA